MSPFWQFTNVTFFGESPLEISQGFGGVTCVLVRHESATVLAAESAVEKVPTQHISYPALSRSQ